MSYTNGKIPFFHIFSMSNNISSLSTIDNSCAIRVNYERFGIKLYYKDHGHTYINPHGNLIINSFKTVFDIMINKIENPNIKMLDFACGTGIISSSVIHLINEFKYNSISIDASDPYLSDHYSIKNKSCYINNILKYGFEDIIKNDLFTGCDGEFDYYYDIMVISFAIHLLDDKYVQFFLNKISYHIKYLLIMSPTKNKGDFSAFSKSGFREIYMNKFVEENTDNKKNIKVFYRLYISQNL